MKHILRIIIVLCLTMTQCWTEGHCSDLKPLYAGQVGHTQYFGKGNEVLLKVINEPRGGNGSYTTSWEYRYADSDTWSTITNLTPANFDGCLSTTQFSNIVFNPDGIYIRRKVVSGNLTAYTNSFSVRNRSSALSFNSQGGIAYIDLSYLSINALPSDCFINQLYYSDYSTSPYPGWVDIDNSYYVTSWNSERPTVKMVNVRENDEDYRSGIVEIFFIGETRGGFFKVDESNNYDYRAIVGFEQTGKGNNAGIPYTITLKDVTIKARDIPPFIPLVKSESDQNWFCWWQYSYDKTNWVDMLDVTNPEVGYQPVDLTKTTYFRLASNNGVDMRATDVVTINVNYDEDSADNPDDTNPLTGNYIMTSAPLVGKTNASPGSADEMTSIKYFDGLGRPTQIVQQGITPARADLVTLTEYDNYGRDWRKWLPAAFAENQGRYVSYENFISKSIETNRDAQPYVQSDCENSPLNRVKTQWGAGETWKTNNKAVQIEYETNGVNDVYNFNLETKQLVKLGYYDAAKLYIKTLKDEDNHIVQEFMDKRNRIILKRNIAEAGNHDTYYVYDEYDNLCYVLPPMASDLMGGGIDQDAINKFAYQYCYDSHNRCISKKLPGADWVEMVYDNADRLILSQDGNQRKDLIWMFNKYDAHGRVIISGKIKETRTKEELRKTIKDLLIVERDTTDNRNYGYTCINYPVVQPNDILLVNYYDKNTILSQTNNENLAFEKLQNQDDRYMNTEVANPEQGLLTGTRVKLLDGSGEILTVYYYDAMRRVVQTRRTNHLGGYDLEYTAFSFTGMPLKTKKVHKIPSNPDVTEEYAYNYDHANRLTQTIHSLNGASPVVLSTLVYDELGQLKSKVIHNSTDTINYSYNVRGWLKSINSHNFNETLHYETAYNGSTQCYNGNISVMEWNTGYGENQKRSYQYKYDQLNRMKDAVYSPDDIFSEKITQYDKNGNILGISRNGYVDKLATEEQNVVDKIDNLTLSYNGNQLTKVAESDENVDGVVPVGTNDFHDRQGAPNEKEYLYDANGNMTGDFNKNIAWIKYNYLNLPEKIQFSNGNTCEYLYDALGVKHRAIYRTSLKELQIPLGAELQTTPDSLLQKPTQTDYCGNYIYDAKMLRKILTPEGSLEYVYYQPPISKPGGPKYIPPRPGSRTPYWQYSYLIKDHLGNVRIQLMVDTCRTSKSYQIAQVNDYYPFGMEIKDQSIQLGGSRYLMDNLYRYNGKELDPMHGLNWYDYGARWYDPTIAKWNVVDPLGEKYPNIGPYVYCLENPVKFIDPDGRTPRVYVETKGLGHTFITTGEGKNTTVYTYGRYGGLDQNKSSGRQFSISGEGVLIIMKGEEAFNYLTQAYKNMEASIYEIKDASDSKIDTHFKEIFDSSDKKPSAGFKKNSTNAKVVDKYNLLENNCTTKSVEAIKVGTDGELDLNSKSPAEIETKLYYEKQDNDKVKQVHLKNVLDEYKK